MGTAGQVMHLLGRAARFTGQALDRFGSRLRGVAGAHCQEECKRGGLRPNVLGYQGVLGAVPRHCTIMDVFGKTPVIAKSVFVAPSSCVMGDVEIGENSSIWYGCVLRGDVHRIKVGSGTNIQDNTLVHVAKTNVSGNVAPTNIGSRVTIGPCIVACEDAGHNVVLHACTVEDEALVGMGATVLDGAVVEKGAMVAAGSLVTQKTRIPSGQIWAGNPARFLRKLTSEEQTHVLASAGVYVNLAEIHAKENAKTSEEIEADKMQRRKWDQQSDDYDSQLGIVRSKPPMKAFPDKMISKGLGRRGAGTETGG